MKAKRLTTYERVLQHLRDTKTAATVADLVRDLNVNRRTLCTALQLLVQDGLVRRYASLRDAANPADRPAEKPFDLVHYPRRRQW